MIVVATAQMHTAFLVNFGITEENYSFICLFVLLCRLEKHLLRVQEDLQRAREHIAGDLFTFMWFKIIG